jgi:hypothetical protein
MSSVTVDLLLKYGFAYDHSQAYRDFVPFYARTGDRWTTIDYLKDAGDWMKPLQHGKEIDLAGPHAALDVGRRVGPAVRPDPPGNGIDVDSDGCEDLLGHA